MRRTLALVGGMTILCSSGWADEPTGSAGQWRQHDMKRPTPRVVEPATGSVASGPPKDAVVLFDGSNLDAWHGSGNKPAAWNVADGVMTVKPGAGQITTKQSFGDIQLHIEWSSPNPPRGTGQDRGNSGVFLMNQFEIQVIDSFQARTYADGQAGAIYGQYPPLFNPARPPGEWQTYDIAFRRPRYDSAKNLVEKARITVFFNGLLVQNNEEPFGETSWLRWSPSHGDRGAISLQDHSHPVRFRNIWVREMPERIKPTASEFHRHDPVTLSAEVLEKYVGSYVQGTDKGGAKIKVSRDGDHLNLRMPFLPTNHALIPFSETEFDMPTTDAQLTFRTNADGQVLGALFRIADGEREWTRVEP